MGGPGVNIHANDLGFLQSRMSDQAVAAMLGKSVPWVQARREWLANPASQLQAQEPAPVVEPEPVVAPPPSWQQSKPRTPKVAAWREKAQAAPAAGPCAEPDEARLDHPGALQRADADTDGTGLREPARELIGPKDQQRPFPSPWLGCPPGLAGVQLADWLYDNTELTLPQIAEATGLGLDQVRAIADGEPQQQAAAPAPATTLPPPPPEPPRRPPAAAPRPMAKRRATTAQQLPPVPAKVVRWAGWFLAAGWSVPEVAHLFDVTAARLRASVEARP